jgi:hypothetical protein
MHISGYITTASYSIKRVICPRVHCTVLEASSWTSENTPTARRFPANSKKIGEPTSGLEPLI